MPNNAGPKFPSELRYNFIAKNWVIIATGRAKRPDLFKVQRRQEEDDFKTCPFCDISTQEKPTLIFSRGKTYDISKDIPGDWTTVVVPNKFPVVAPFSDLNPRKIGKFYQKVNAAGFHEVIVTRDHKKHLALLSLEEVKEVIDAYQLRYLALKNQQFVNHISIFHNHGAEAGATISHPHSQLLTTPLVDNDLNTALITAREYWHKEKQCAYCQMNLYELEVKERLVYENEHFLAVCPFASKSAFETIISPKEHSPYFEGLTEKQKELFAHALKTVLFKIYKGLHDPAYNFYIHSSPPDGSEHDYYHWHLTILPKTSIWAGFEIGTKMEISTIEPEKAAEYLRKQ